MKTLGFPLTYLLPQLAVTVAHRRVRGLESPGRIFPEFSMEHLWIEGVFPLSTNRNRKR